MPRTPRSADAAAAAAAAAAAEAELPAYQQAGRAHLAGYLNNLFDDAGRQAIQEQFWEAPLAGYARRAGEHLGLSEEHAAIAERTLAGLLATGVGVPAFLAAVDGLRGNPQPPAMGPAVVVTQ